MAVTVNASATLVVAPNAAPLVNAGASAGTSLTVTLTTCVATPCELLAVKVNVCTPMSFAGGT